MNTTIEADLALALSTAHTAIANNLTDGPCGRAWVAIPANDPLVAALQAVGTPTANLAGWETPTWSLNQDRGWTVDFRGDRSYGHIDRYNLIFKLSGPHTLAREVTFGQVALTVLQAQGWAQTAQLSAEIDWTPDLVAAVYDVQGAIAPVLHTPSAPLAAHHPAGVCP